MSERDLQAVEVAKIEDRKSVFIEDTRSGSGKRGVKVHKIVPRSAGITKSLENHVMDLSLAYHIANLKKFVVGKVWRDLLVGKRYVELARSINPVYAIETIAVEEVKIGGASYASLKRIERRTDPIIGLRRSRNL